MPKPRIAADAATEAKKDGKVKPEDDGPTINVALDGVEHTVFINRLNGLDTLALDRALGITPLGLLQLVATGHLLEQHVMAGIVWLARRQAGEPDLTFEAVAVTMTFEGIVNGLATPAAVADKVEVEAPGDPKG